MADADGTDCLAFSSGKLEYQRTLVHSPRLEDEAGVAGVGPGPVDEGGAGGGGGEGDRC